MSVRERERERLEEKDMGIQRQMENCSIDSHFLKHDDSIFRAPLSTSSASWSGYAREPLGYCLLWALASHDSVTDHVYIISQCPCVTVVNLHDPLLAVNPCQLLTPTHYLFFSHPFVYTAGTSCSRNPWLTSLLKVNMQWDEINSIIHTRIVNILYAK